MTNWTELEQLRHDTFQLLFVFLAMTNPTHSFVGSPVNLVCFTFFLSFVHDFQPSSWPLGLAQSSFYPQIVLPQGILRGRRMRTEDDKEFIGFLGIPYAKAPVGPLRFKVRNFQTSSLAP